ncbi:hypothetical protein [Pseudoclavibacter sp. 8L]|uniref:hypothetical protein n=1 Tax=Pseudoclavibacter sp. 8L TaxID=2653162 RepID=UPI0012F2E14F|nr:hypothetical protein [Pseudoclavibacter sp. 8L]VXB74869.1 conserved hypothetical protein [Pseudoclavibacter sp. 8L]
MDRHFQLDDLALYVGQPHEHFEGLLLTENGVSGWHEGVDVRREVTERHAGAGSFDSIGTLDARVVAFEGLITAQGIQKFETLRRQVSSFGTGGNMIRISEAAGNEQWWARGRLGARTSVSVARAGSLLAPFKITLWCPDPRIYGAAYSFGPAPAVFVEQTAGTYPSRPRITVRATSSMLEGYGVNLMRDGATLGAIRIQAPLAAGSTHVIDMVTGQVLNGATPILGGVQSGNVWAIPPAGTYYVHLAPNSGAGTITVTGYDNRV